MALAGDGHALEGMQRLQPASDMLLVQSRRGGCKSVSSCREAVIMWCNGYRRADGDGDGIPCENVCPDKQTVDRIRKDIGC
ncbi:hypothetical protein [Nitratireductor pacificus]|uniref:hypothetical protein n=1 Tax=Nitratireductor pacificus TaxID=1231180 RepID=UPI0002FF758A|nr:hypothetical protein [Nitratireductor pacificus]